MNTIITVLAALLTLDFPSADTNLERSVSAPFAPHWDGLGTVTLTVAFAPSPTNEYAIAFGEDLDGDGELSLLEAELTLDCDCGAWSVIKTATGDVTPTGEEPADGSPVTRQIILRRRELDPRWNRLRLTRRGSGDAASLTLTESHPGTVLVIR